MLRRRGAEHGYERLAEADALEEPLLEGEAPHGDSQGKARGGGRYWRVGTAPPPSEPAASRALVPHSINRVDWLALWRALCCGCQGGLRRVWSSIACCLETLLPQVFAPPPLRPSEQIPLDELRGRVGEQYDAANPSHAEALRELWGLAFPGTPWGGPRNPHWREMGWQQDDPATDFRGGGLLSLHNLLYLAREKPKLWRQLLHKEQGRRSEWEYPFAVAGVNLTYQLVEALDLRSFRPPAGAAQSPPGIPRTPAGRAFVSLLPDSASAFEEVYCLAFEVLDREWLAMGASYMDFAAVMARTKGAVTDALGRRPLSLGHLRQLLLEERGGGGCL